MLGAAHFCVRPLFSCVEALTVADVLNRRKDTLMLDPRIVKSIEGIISEKGGSPDDLQEALAAAEDLKVPEFIKPYPEHRSADRVKITCSRCNGTGHHYHRCWGCRGTGSHDVLVSSLRATAKKRHQKLVEELAREACKTFYQRQYAKNHLQNCLEEAYAENERRSRLITGFVGTVGERVDNIMANLTKARDVGGTWPSRLFHAVDIQSGKSLSWFSGSSTAFTLQEGDTVLIYSAVVKEHRNWDGQDYTYLSRVRAELLE